VENLASADASSITGSDNGTYLSEPSYVCRFALIVCIYAGVAIIQAIFWCGIYAWFVEDSLQQFIDVCSIANISVFVMANNNFGYYIHGK
jgi:meckelin